MVNSWRVQQAAREIRAGAVLAYPTEAVWGLGCDPAHEAAVMKLLQLKQRPVEKGMILVAADLAQLEGWVRVDALPAERKAEVLDIARQSSTLALSAANGSGLSLNGTVAQINSYLAADGLRLDLARHERLRPADAEVFCIRAIANFVGQHDAELL